MPRCLHRGGCPGSWLLAGCSLHRGVPWSQEGKLLALVLIKLHCTVLHTAPEADPTNISIMPSICRGASMPALSLPCYPSKAKLGHFILLHSTFCSALFTSFWFSPLFIFALLPGPPPLALHFDLSLIPYPRAHASCPLPYFSHSSVFPCTSVSGDLCLPYASRHFHQHSFWKFCWCLDWVTQLMWELATWIPCVFS